MFDELNEIKTLIISGKKCCKQNKDCEKHEQCSGENCIAVCDLKNCGPNKNCIPKDHNATCACTNGYISDPAGSGCYRGINLTTGCPTLKWWKLNGSEG